MTITEAAKALGNIEHFTAGGSLVAIVGGTQKQIGATTDLGFELTPTGKTFLEDLKTVKK